MAAAGPVCASGGALISPMPSRSAVPSASPRSTLKVHRFSVKFFDFSLRGVPHAQEPFLRVDFDHFKCFQTDRERLPEHLYQQQHHHVFEWGFKAGFIYQTRALEKLSVKKFKIFCYDHHATTSSGSGSQQQGPAALLGSAEIDLRTLACGPSLIRLGLQDSTGNLVQGGQLEFTCLMKMLSNEFTINLKNLRLSIQGWPAAARLEVSSSLREDIIVEAPFSTAGAWEEGISLQFETTLMDLLNTSSREGLRILVQDEGGNEQGTVSLSFRDYFDANLEKARLLDSKHTPLTRQQHRFEVREAVTYGDEGDQVGELSGVLTYASLPKYAQMIGGVLERATIQGERIERIEGGYMLVPGLPYPVSLQQPPPAFSEEAKNIGEDVERDDGQQLAGSNGSTGRFGFAPPALGEEFEGPKWNETPDDIDLPPNWELRKASSGRPYFADHRTKKTSWTDPRFMPDNWDQRADPITGKVYFAYHKTRQTTFVDPRGMPPGWEMRLSRSGIEYFAYYPTKQTSWTDPRGLEDGIDMCLDPKGRVYFRDHRDGTTSWDDPRERVPNPMALRKWEYRQWWKHQVALARAAYEEAVAAHAEQEKIKV
ncbi:unnamed protein product [Amoebophrya sp. A25]|nr:unnamed protein product [Amoebophrya sp. A25]|eukprot:GSA25T00020728001.1